MCNKLTGECLCSSVEEVIQNHGKDWSNLNFLNSIDLRSADLTKIVLPKDPLFLQKIMGKSLIYTRFSSQDLSDYDWKGVRIVSARFNKDTVLPADENFLQIISDKSIYYTHLPEMDMSSWCWNDVLIVGAQFYKNTKLPLDKNFLQILRGKSLAGCVMPEMDMTCWNWIGIDVDRCVFSDNTILPNTPDFLSNLKGNLTIFEKLPYLDMHLNWDFSNKSLPLSLLKIKDVSKIKYFSYKPIRAMLLLKSNISDISIEDIFLIKNLE